uniref:Uncharacterized protein n=1 Tax=Anguilla anguilla TaxID=7936 RepID=A0A0E9WLN1_ANGAN
MIHHILLLYESADIMSSLSANYTHCMLYKLNYRIADTISLHWNVANLKIYFKQFIGKKLNFVCVYIYTMSFIMFGTNIKF